MKFTFQNDFSEQLTWDSYWCMAEISTILSSKYLAIENFFLIKKNEWLIWQCVGVQLLSHVWLPSHGLQHARLPKWWQTKKKSKYPGTTHRCPSRVFKISSPAIGIIQKEPAQQTWTPESLFNTWSNTLLDFKHRSLSACSIKFHRCGIRSYIFSPLTLYFSVSFTEVYLIK